MRELFFKIFSDKYTANPTPLFGLVHIILIIFAIGGSIGLSLLLKNKSDSFKDKTLKIASLIVISLYIFDFFVQPFWNGGYMYEGKLPFHICTLTGILLTFVTFNKRFDKLKVVVAVWAALAPSAFILFPVTLIDSEVSILSYSKIQSFLYHTVEAFWGIFILISGKVKLEWKTLWQPIVALFPMAIWATIGQEMFYPNEPGENFLMLRLDLQELGIDMERWVFYVLLFLIATTVISLLYLMANAFYKRKINKN
ncbi:MAG: YwaF family protein [Clostridia bacterium]|nr:YwaF family protein [Clostridia bacterium]